MLLEMLVNIRLQTSMYMIQGTMFGQERNPSELQFCSVTKPGFYTLCAFL